MRIAVVLAALAMVATQAMANVDCGGEFGDFVGRVKAEAVNERGHSRSTVDAFFASVAQDPEVIRMDNRQGIFKKSFIEFSKLVMAEYRVRMSREFEAKHGPLFDRVYQRFGVDRGVLLAFLALETDFGLVQGDFNTLNSLVTLAHNCRRPGLFRPHVFAALELYERGDFDPAGTIGAWAGEIGMIQMLPEDILNYGQDEDGDGRVDLKGSTADALMTAGRVLSELGWRPREPWLVEISVPQSLDWSETGLHETKRVSEWKRQGATIRSGDTRWDDLQASVLLPHGRKGPAFFAFPNFHIYFEWNRSFVYVTTSAFFANLLSGVPMYLDGNPDPALSDAEMKALQAALAARGHDIGPVDGILGRRTRAAVQAEQAALGLPADAWPTRQLLDLVR